MKLINEKKIKKAIRHPPTHTILRPNRSTESFIPVTDPTPSMMCKQVYRNREIAFHLLTSISQGMY